MFTFARRSTIDCRIEDPLYCSNHIHYSIARVLRPILPSKQGLHCSTLVFVLDMATNTLKLLIDQVPMLLKPGASEHINIAKEGQSAVHSIVC